MDQIQSKQQALIIYSDLQSQANHTRRNEREGERERLREREIWGNRK